MGFPFKQIQDILSDVNGNFHRINSGGCCVMASMLAYQMEKIVDDIRIVTSDWRSGRWYNLDKIRSNITHNTDMGEWEENGVGFHHVWIEFKWNGRWYAMDSNGILPRNQFYHRWGTPYNGSFTLNEARAFARCTDWNPSFERWQIPHMRRMVSNKFNKLFDTLEVSYQ